MRKITLTEHSCSPQIPHQLFWDQTGPPRREGGECGGWFTGCQVCQLLFKNVIVSTAFCIMQPCNLVDGCRRSRLFPHFALNMEAVYCCRTLVPTSYPTQRYSPEYVLSPVRKAMHWIRVGFRPNICVFISNGNSNSNSEK